MFPALPAQPGAYWLMLRLETDTTLTVGRLGAATFPAGWYVYTGSARGPGGIRARLGRHVRGGARPRWHIDALRKYAPPVAWGWTTAPDPAQPWECHWAHALAAMPAAFVPLPGFGASDCRFHCPAHLIGFRSPDALQHALHTATRGTMGTHCTPACILETLC